MAQVHVSFGIRDEMGGWGRGSRWREGRGGEGRGRRGIGSVNCLVGIHCLLFPALATLTDAREWDTRLGV